MTENKAVIMVINEHQVMKAEIKNLRKELFEAADKYVTVRDELREVKKTWKKLFKLVK